MCINRASEARIDVGSQFGDPIPQTFNTVAIGCLEDWIAPGQVPGGIEPGDSVIESCSVVDCDKRETFTMNDDREVRQIASSGLCIKIANQ